MVHLLCLGITWWAQYSRFYFEDCFFLSPGSDKERSAVAKAAKFSSRAEDLEPLYEDNNEDVEFTYDSPKSANGDIHIKLTAKNTSKEARTIKLKFSSHAVYYTGVIGMDLDEQDHEAELQGGECM